MGGGQKRNSEAITILAGIVIGFLVGLAANRYELKFLVSGSDFLGELFIRLLRLLVVPLIFVSIVVGVISTGSLSRLGKLAAKTMLYIFFTTSLAAILGLAIVNTVKPGKGMTLLSENASEQVEKAQNVKMSDLLKKIIPTNAFKAMADGDVLGVIFLAIFLGFGLVALQEKAEPLKRFLESFNDVMLFLTRAVMKLAPIGIAALLAALIGKLGLKPLLPLAKYLITLLIGLGIHSLVILPLVVLVFARVNPYRVYYRILPALVTAFSTSSSNATLPVSMRVIEEDVGVSQRVSSFVVPVGATINMNGTALYEAVAALFIAQAYGIELSIAQQSLVVLTAVIAAIGTPGMPQAGLITMVIVLNAVGLPTEGVGMVIAVDRIADMMRTTVNVQGDLFSAVVIARSEGEALKL